MTDQFLPPPFRFDPWLFWSTSILISIGLVMIGSASMHLSHSAFQFVIKQSIALLIGMIAALPFLTMSTHWWAKYSPLFYLFTLFLLLAVWIPGLGRTVNGATRWVHIGFLLQPAELLKLSSLLFIAYYLSRRQVEVVHTPMGMVKPLILLALSAILLMAQPDFGSTVVILATVMGLLFLAGAPLWQFGLLMILALLGAVFLVLTSDYRLRRVTSFINPWSDPTGAGYQLSQALIAFGRGEWFGVGLGQGVQKQFYLPEAHTDFILAVIGEEWGLFGFVLIVSLFAIIVWRSFAIAARAEALKRRFDAFVAYGIGLWLGMQASINIGVNIGLLPTKGLTLPFISYGSNSLIVSCMAIAALLRIHWQNQVDHQTAAKPLWRL